jgi:DNA-directed RNA polymerase subunit RPC12/RpoP
MSKISSIRQGHCTVKVLALGAVIEEIHVSGNAFSHNYKCVHCQGKLSFDPTVQKLRCESCQQLQPIPQESETHSIVEYKLEDGLARAAERGYGLETRTVSCQNCGAIVSLDSHLTATNCSFCSSNQVLELKDHRQVIRPESVVPFSIEAKVIHDLFSRWVRSLWFRPNALKRLARVSEVRGVYIPYWVFDATVHSDWQALAGYYYYETEHYTERGADGRMEHKTRQVQKVRWVPADGSRTDVYDEFLMCASQGLSQELAARLRTFDTSSLKTYEPAYLVGWCAEEYQIGLNDSWQRAVALMEQEQMRRCSGDVPGDTQRGLSVQNEFSEERFKHVLLPIWISAYRYKDKTFQFLVNGQTGEVQGKAPLSFWKITFLVLFLLIVAGAMVWFLQEGGMVNEPYSDY